MFSRLKQGLLLLLALTSAASIASMPTEDFFRHAEFDDAAISPTGQYLAVTAPGEEGRNLAVLDISDPTDMKITAAFRMRRSESPVNVRWVSDERLIFESILQVGSLAAPLSTGRVYATNADGSNQRQLFGSATGGRVFRQMSVLDLLPDEPDWILIEHWAHDRTRPLAEWLNVRTGRTSGVATSPLERGGLLTDHEHKVRFAYGTNLDMVPEFAWRPDEDSDWITLEHQLGSHVSPIAFAPDGESVYVSSREPDKLGVYKVTLATGEVEPLINHDHVEVHNVLWNADHTELVAVSFMDGKPEWHAVDEDAREIAWLRQLEVIFEDHQIHISNWTRDARFAMVAVGSDRAPAEYFVLDTEERDLRFIAASRPWIDPQRMATMEPFSFEARDGMELHGYLTMPPEHDGDSPVPMVVYVHGGPHGIRDNWGFGSWSQFFASNGFGVLQVNYRGSGGYGIEYEQAGYLEWGAAMQDDVTDATYWAMEQGYADPDRTCLAGGSYGAYSTLVGITREPDLYACAWAFVGLYDLIEAKEEGNIPGSEMGRRYLDRVLGTDEEVLYERSPSNFVERIKTPLFISHGEEDRQTHVNQYHLLKDKLDEAGIAYEELLVKGEGHGFYKVENNVLMMDQVIDFMRKHTE